MRLVYYFILLPISYLPRTWQYRLARFIKVILRDVIRYRRRLIQTNLALCFPEVSDSARKQYLNDFYANLSQIIIESISAFSLTEKQASERLRVVNPDILDRFFKEGRDVIITGGHFANWEAATLSANQIKHDLYALYKPLKNTFMEKKVKDSRSKFGIHMISIKDFRRYMEEPHTKPRAFLFGIDQSPRKSSGEWVTFLGRESMVFTGPERLSKEYDMAIVSGRLRRIARGKYEITYEVLFEKPHETKEMEITIATMKDVESLIHERPGDWLWSHNRWKHSKSSAQDV